MVPAMCTVWRMKFPRTVSERKSSISSWRSRDVDEPRLKVVSRVMLSVASQSSRLSSVPTQPLSQQPSGDYSLRGSWSCARILPYTKILCEPESRNLSEPSASPSPHLHHRLPKEAPALVERSLTHASHRQVTLHGGHIRPQMRNRFYESWVGGWINNWF